MAGNRKEEGEEQQEEETDQERIPSGSLVRGCATGGTDRRIDVGRHRRPVCEMSTRACIPVFHLYVKIYIYIYIYIYTYTYLPPVRVYISVWRTVVQQAGGTVRTFDSSSSSCSYGQGGALSLSVSYFVIHCECRVSPTTWRPSPPRMDDVLSLSVLRLQSCAVSNGHQPMMARLASE
jgi:hypothetical protein